MSQDFSLPGVLEGWEVATQASGPAPLSFGVPEAVEVLPVWRTALPADPAEASAQLKRAEQQLRAAQAALDALPQRVDALVARSAAGAPALASFAIEPLPGPEAELLGLLASAGAETGEVSFGLAGIALPDWRQIKGSFTASLQKLTQTVTRLALVETSVGGDLVGRTIIDWSGDLQTAWQPPMLLDRASQHKRSLQNALAARSLLLKMVLLTIQSTSKIVASLAVPGGMFMALPAVWKFVTRVINELEQFQNLDGGN